MTDQSLLRLLAWLSPGFPVGAYSYSHGIEYAVEAGKVHNVTSLTRWVETVLEIGSGRADAILFCTAWRAVATDDARALHAVAEHAAALRPTAELGLESTAQGDAFAKAIATAWPQRGTGPLPNVWDGPVAYPVAVAAACAAHDIALTDGLGAYLHAFAANLISAGVRLIPLGQSDGQRIMAAMEISILRMTAVVSDLPLTDAGAAAWMVDYCSMKHETQRTRLFRS